MNAALASLQGDGLLSRLPHITTEQRKISHGLRPPVVNLFASTGQVQRELARVPIASESALASLVEDRGVLADGDGSRFVGRGRSLAQDLLR
jgi:hypothetical protein